ncbi:hypothetical protein L1987_16129 [Smallanthus sonchifolius]|uniref:Uncharacterized protein n=1 Tax=Smallanthus sonchifolius TaxID=185202 RepID=A0ACB9JB02_9ASTR|nr:hypothetical protein L1987_16129 [Smallanthus sonchifolius]
MEAGVYQYGDWKWEFKNPRKILDTSKNFPVVHGKCGEVCMAQGFCELDIRYVGVGNFQSDVELDTNVRPDPINQEESNDPFSSHNVIEELNNQEMSKVDHVTTESEYVEDVTVEFVVSSHQEDIVPGQHQHTHAYPDSRNAEKSNQGKRSPVITKNHSGCQ